MYVAIERERYRSRYRKLIHTLVIRIVYFHTKSFGAVVRESAIFSPQNASRASSEDIFLTAHAPMSTRQIGRKCERYFCDSLTNR